MTRAGEDVSWPCPRCCWACATARHEWHAPLGVRVPPATSKSSPTQISPLSTISKSQTHKCQSLERQAYSRNSSHTTTILLASQSVLNTEWYEVEEYSTWNSLRGHGAFLHWCRRAKLAAVSGDRLGIHGITAFGLGARLCQYTPTREEEREDGCQGTPKLRAWVLIDGTDIHARQGPPCLSQAVAGYHSELPVLRHTYVPRTWPAVVCYL